MMRYKVLYFLTIAVFLSTMLPASSKQAVNTKQTQALKNPSKKTSKKPTSKKPILPIKRKVSSLTDILQDSTKEEESSQKEWVKRHSEKDKNRKPQSLNYKGMHIRWVRDEEATK